MGLTETGSQISTNPMPPALRKIGSPGKAYGNEIMIGNEDQAPVGPGIIGEILVRGANVMQGYFKQPEETAKTITSQGWLQTGDLGYMDEDGFIFVSGRIKELIIKGGENIAPREIDEVLLEHEAILEAAAFAVRCPDYGERVEACIRFKETKSVPMEDLHDHCKARLGNFKSPDVIHVLADLPKGPSGKVQRLKLFKLILSLFTCLLLNAQIDRVERIPEYIGKAYNIATSGRPGPVVIAVPENILNERSTISDRCFAQHYEPAPNKSVEADIEGYFTKSLRPLIIVGGSSWCEIASSNVLRFANKYSIPVASGFRRQDLLDNFSSVFCGSFGTSVSPSLLKRVREADLLLVVGSRLGEMTTQGYKILNGLGSNQKLIHVHVDSKELGAVYTPDLGIVSTAKNFSDLLINLEFNQNSGWKDWCKILRSEHLFDLKPPIYSGPLDLAKIFSQLNDTLPRDCIITLDAGNHTGWPQRFLSYSPKRRQIGSTCGAMGYSVPAAVAVALTSVGTTVISFVGDGGFMMSGMELMTAVQYRIPIIVIVFNNNSYGTIRMHQEKENPGRVMATNLQNPNFKAMAVAMGAYGETVEKTDDFAPALERCLRKKKPALIELKTDINQLSTRFNLDENCSQNFDNF